MTRSNHLGQQMTYSQSGRTGSPYRLNNGHGTPIQPAMSHLGKPADLIGSLPLVGHRPPLKTTM